MTQIQRITEYIKTHGSITPKEGFAIGIERLAARVNDMRNRGIPVITERATGLNQYGEKVWFARYRIGGEVQARE